MTDVARESFIQLARLLFGAPTSTSTACRAQRFESASADFWIGSAIDATTRRIPAWMRASVQGGVRP